MDPFGSVWLRSCGQTPFMIIGIRHRRLTIKAHVVFLAPLASPWPEGTKPLASGCLRVAIAEWAVPDDKDWASDASRSASPDVYEVCHEVCTACTSLPTPAMVYIMLTGLQRSPVHAWRESEAHHKKSSNLASQQSQQFWSWWTCEFDRRLSRMWRSDQTLLSRCGSGSRCSLSVVYRRWEPAIQTL